MLQLKQNLSNLFISVLCLLALPSCLWQKEQADTCSGMSSVSYYEAKYPDIPFPLGAQFVAHDSMSSEDGLAVVFTFTSSLSVEESAEFYRVEMERYGWQQAGLFNLGQEITLLFDKPSKRVVIHSKQGPKTCIKLYYGPVKD